MASHPFYLDTERGRRFCIWHRAAAEPRGAVLYVPPFAEEMNKSRRMAAMQSRMFAASGYAVLQIDLYGCGDSDGELRDATWDIWKQDLAAAVGWLRQQAEGPLYLWGLRLGATLALDYARSGRNGYAGYLLWQPVVSGEAYLTQFLRLRMAAGLTGGAEKASTEELRGALASGLTLEVAGYELTPGLADSIAAVDLNLLAPRQGTVYWLELVASEAGKPRAAQRVVDAWARAGIDLDVREVVGEPFWSTVEIVDSRALLEATMAAFTPVPA